MGSFPTPSLNIRKHEKLNQYRKEYHVHEIKFIPGTGHFLSVRGDTLAILCQVKDEDRGFLCERSSIIEIPYNKVGIEFHKERIEPTLILHTELWSDGGGLYHNEPKTVQSGLLILPKGYKIFGL